MRIVGWEIGHFGMFEGTEVMNLPKSGVTVFCGQNESGKTTIVSFIKGIIFGFHTQPELEPFLKNSENHPPRGKVYIEMDDGQYVIQREGNRPANVTLPDGRQGTEIDLQRLLGGADHQVFRSVFAFSAQELHELGALGADGVRERIFSASIVGAGRSAGDIAKQLDQRMEKLFSPFNSDAQGNRVVSEIKNAASRLEIARSAAARYDEKILEREKLKKIVSDLGESRVAITKTRLTYEKLLEMWPVWCERKNRQTALSECPASPDFPDGAEEILETVVAGLKEYRTDLMKTISDQRKALRQRRHIKNPERANAARMHEVEDLTVGAQMYLDRKEKQHQARLEVERNAQRVESKLKSLKLGIIDEHKVAAVMAAFPNRTHLRHWEEKRETAERDVSRLAQEKKNAEFRHADLARSKELIENRMGAEPTRRSDLRLEEEAIIRLRANLATMLALEVEMAQLCMVRDDAQTKHQSLQTMDTYSVPPFLTPLAWVAGAVVASAGAWKLWSGELASAIGFECSAVFLCAVTWGYSRLKRQIKDQHDSRPKQMDDVTAKIHEIEVLLEPKDQQRIELQTQLAKDAAIVGLHAEPTFHLIEEVHSVWFNKKLKRNAFDADKAELDLLRPKLEEAEKEMREKTLAYETAVKARQEIETFWKNECRNWAPLQTPEPKDAVYIAEQIRELLEQIQARGNAKNTVESLDKFVTAYEERVRSLLALTENETSPEELINKLSVFRERCVADRETQTHFLTLESEILARNLHMKKVKREYTDRKKCLRRMLQSVDAANEADYRTALGHFKKRRGLQHRLREIENDFTKKLGTGPHTESLSDELEKGRIAEWKVELSSTVDKESALEKERESTFLRIGALDAEIHRIEESAAVVRAGTELHGLKDDLTGIIRSYRKLALAKALLSESLKDYEQSRQSEILTEASTMLSEATEGRYTRITYTEAGRNLMVLSGNGLTLGVDELSRSTQEILYLTIRLGLVQELSRRLGQSFPLLMDDILVNCDPHRAERTARMMVTFAKKHQVLFFTCHPVYRDIFRMSPLRVDESSDSPSTKAASS